MNYNFSECRLCPRECKADRNISVGFCGAPSEIRVARAALHFWEEPCISGTRGSGTVFFSGCSLRCVYCQNIEISDKNFGKTISVRRLAEIFEELQQSGAHNINLVTPTHYVPQIIEAIEISKNRINIPFVYNTSGYETVETIKMLKNYISIYLADIKYFSSEYSKKYSTAPNYFEKASAAVHEMINQTGAPEFDENGMLKSGVIIRHMVIPSLRKDSICLLNELSKRFDKTDFILSLMRQYTPNGNLENYPEINRRLTTFEYKSVVSEAVKLGFTNGYMQEAESADRGFTPDFDLTGI